MNKIRVKNNERKFETITAIERKLARVYSKLVRSKTAARACVQSVSTRADNFLSSSRIQQYRRGKTIKHNFSTELTNVKFEELTTATLDILNVTENEFNSNSPRTLRIYDFILSAVTRITDTLLHVLNKSGCLLGFRVS